MNFLGKNIQNFWNIKRVSIVSPVYPPSIPLKVKCCDEEIEHKAAKEKLTKHVFLKLRANLSFADDADLGGSLLV